MHASSGTTHQSAVVFGHADGDGYLAAEVSRRNLVAEGWAVNEVVVDPQKTASFRFWEGHFQERDFTYVDLAVTVDLAFDFKDPMHSCDALSHRAAEFPATRFVVIDHHHLPAAQWLPTNVTLVESGSVYRCCYGDPNDLMVIASVCDHDEEPIKDLLSPAHRILAKGVSRAARDIGGVAGHTLSQMLENEHWAWLFTLGSEPNEFHRTYYGRRTKNAQPSAALLDANSIIQ